MATDIFMVPVFALRFTHDTVDASLQFRNQCSIYKTLDDMQRGRLSPENLNEPLDVCLVAGRLYSLSNRRLLTCRMFQSLHLDRAVQVPCVMRSEVWNGGKFRRAFTTKNEGLGVEACERARGKKATLDSEQRQHSLHGGRSVFRPAEAAMQVLSDLLQGSGHEGLLSLITFRPSKNAADPSLQSLTFVYGAGPECEGSAATRSSDLGVGVSDSEDGAVPPPPPLDDDGYGEPVLNDIIGGALGTESSSAEAVRRDRQKELCLLLEESPQSVDLWSALRDVGGGVVGGFALSPMECHLRALHFQGAEKRTVKRKSHRKARRLV